VAAADWNDCGGFLDLLVVSAKVSRKETWRWESGANGDDEQRSVAVVILHVDELLDCGRLQRLLKPVEDEV